MICPKFTQNSIDTWILNFVFRKSNHIVVPKVYLLQLAICFIETVGTIRTIPNQMPA